MRWAIERHWPQTGPTSRSGRFEIHGPIIPHIPLEGNFSFDFMSSFKSSIKPQSGSFVWFAQWELGATSRVSPSASRLDICLQSKHALMSFFSVSNCVQFARNARAHHKNIWQITVRTFQTDCHFVAVVKSPFRKEQETWTIWVSTTKRQACVVAGFRSLISTSSNLQNNCNTLMLTTPCGFMKTRLWTYDVWLIKQ